MNFAFINKVFSIRMVSFEPKILCLKNLTVYQLCWILLIFVYVFIYGYIIPNSTDRVRRGLPLLSSQVLILSHFEEFLCLTPPKVAALANGFKLPILVNVNAFFQTLSLVSTTILLKTPSL